MGLLLNWDRRSDDPGASRCRCRAVVGTGLAGLVGIIVAMATPGTAVASPAFFAPSSYLSHFSTTTNVGSTVPANGDVNPYGIIVAMAAPGTAVASPAFFAPSSYLSHFSTTTNVGSTVPANGDVNPYGITVVPQSVGRLVRGDTLVSSFNNATNLQGTGTTIVEIAPSGALTTFAQLSGALSGSCPGGIGLTTALTVLPGGWTVVGSLPTSDGMSDTAKAGCLIVLNSMGTAVETWSGGNINGPWDLTAVSAFGRSAIFVSNVLNGTVAHSPSTVDRGTVVRLDVALTGGASPRLLGSTVVGSRFAERTDQDALVVGPTGLALGNGGQLYVADTVNSRIAVIPFALWRPFRQRVGVHHLVRRRPRRAARVGVGTQR